MKFLVFVALAFLANKAYAADETFWQMVGRDFASPVTTSASQVLLPGVLVTVFLDADREHIDYPFQRQTVADKPLGSTAKYGDALGQLIPNAIYILGMGSYGHFKKNDLATERAILMLKASIYSGVVTDVMKPIANEERPDSTSNHQSFPSGHSTSAFAFASVVGAEHGWAWGVPAYAMATFVAYSRINDNQHYLHDVVAGATIGTVYGLGVYYRSVESGQHPSKTGDKIAVLPDVHGDYLGLNLFAEM